jgi:phage tail tape-measure protein
MLSGPHLKSSERDIRDTIGTLNSEQLAGLEQEYRSGYGNDLKGALRCTANRSSSTKYFLEYGKLAQYIVGMLHVRATANICLAINFTPPKF